MADLSDVQNVLVGLIASALYPNGTGQASAVGFTVRIGSGWPTAASLDPDLLAGIANVTVYGTNQERKTTRYRTGWQQLTTNAPTLTLTTSGQVVTVGGTNPTPYTQQNCAVFVNGTPYTYAVQAADTAQSIATALAAVINVGVPGTVSSGAAITLPTGANIGAVRVGGTGTAVSVVRNQDRLFQIVLWCSTNAQRVALANVIDPLLSGMTFLSMPDGLNARIIYKDSPQQDLGEKARLFRRDLRYFVDFATTVQMGTAEVIVGEQILSPNGGDAITTQYL